MVDYVEYLRSAKAWWPPLRLPGQYFDAETGLHENWNRFYDPATGQYLSPESMLENPRWVLSEALQGYSTPTTRTRVTTLSGTPTRPDCAFGTAAFWRQAHSWGRRLRERFSPWRFPRRSMKQRDYSTKTLAGRRCQSLLPSPCPMSVRWDKGNATGLQSQRAPLAHGNIVGHILRMQEKSYAKTRTEMDYKSKASGL